MGRCYRRQSFLMIFVILFYKSAKHRVLEAPLQPGVLVQQPVEVPRPLARPGQLMFHRAQTRLQPRDARALLQKVHDRQGLQLHKVLGQVPDPKAP